MKLEFSQQIFLKYSYIKFHENPSSVSQVVPCGQMDRYDKANSHFAQFYKWTDMTKLTVTLHNFTNVPENYIVI